ncbi:MAG: hypothetical protein HND48_22780 [Chloroflexi bacterium]|nr:hypothetical protein [Chloroflexota bacterium]
MSRWLSTVLAARSIELEVERQAHPRAGLPRPVEQLLKAHTGVLTGHQRAIGHAFRRQVGVEEVRDIAQCDRFAGPLREGRIQIVFADPAPRTHGVVNDVDVHQVNSLLFGVSFATDAPLRMNLTRGWPRSRRRL